MAANPKATIDLVKIRRTNLATLREQGFRVAPGLPIRRKPPRLRNRTEILNRFVALNTLCVYIAGPFDDFPTRPHRAMLKDHALEQSLTPGELDALHMRRTTAHNRFRDFIGWSMENLVSLAWALGHTLEPSVNGRMISGRPLAGILRRFAPHSSDAYTTMLAECTTRPLIDIIKMEDLFYCAHNAARSAQFGEEGTVPPRFKPLIGCGVIHERRHALTWMLSPGVEWDDTDLST